MKKVILTGATGYIGRYAIGHLLEKKYVVHAVSSKLQAKKQTDNIIWHKTDLLNSNEVERLIKAVRPTHLLHFAWYVERGKFWNAPENLEWLQASLFLARKFAENGGKRFVAAGTCAEYDWTSKNPFVEDKTPMRPQTLYGASKYALALALEKFAASAGFGFSSGKIFFPFGGGESVGRLVPSVVCALLKNEPAKIFRGNQIRDFMYVEDIAEAFVSLLESEAQGGVNIATGRGVKLKELVRTVAGIIGKPELLEIGALPASENEPPEIVADIGKMRLKLGFEKDYELTGNLIKTIDWWKGNLKL